MSRDEVSREANKIYCRRPTEVANNFASNNHRRFRQLFGVPPFICELI